MIELGENKITFFLMFVAWAYGKICFTVRDFVRAINYLKQCKNLSNNYLLHKFKISCYKYIGKSYLEIKNINIALYYFVKYYKNILLID
jgi:tetratricopeptide (TPR) repeat protein